MNKDQDLVTQMMAKQNELNISTNGANWTDGITKNGKEINWFRCIYMESAELVDSFDWKHWKDINKEPDLKNARIEVVDIWHFIMSQAIVQNISSSKLYQSISKEYKKEEPTEESIIKNAETLMREALNSMLPTGEYCMTDKLFSSFNALMSLLNLDIKDLYELYIAKNWLNDFRQKNGYKEGSYIKNLTVDNTTLEDNELLGKMIDDYDSLDNAFKQYEEFYRTYKEEITSL